MKIACVQPKIFEERDKCYSHVEDLLKNLLKTESLDIACLPERWTPFSHDLSQNFQTERGEDYSFIKDLAKKYNINLLSGGIWELRTKSKKPSIACYFFNQKGDEIGRQDKIHLYSYEQGQFENGKELCLFKFDIFHFAILICFDMAFYETPRLAVENGADILFSPTQIRQDGMENWNIYLQARALENRVPIAACNTVGTIRDRIFLGNSKIISFTKGFISPSKLKLIDAPTGSSGVIWDDIDLIFPRKLRKIRLNEIIDKNNIEVRRINYIK